MVTPVLRPALMASIVACALFMQNLDSTIVATALPQIAFSFHTSPISLSIAITAYVLSLAVFIPISGWMADRFGGSVVFRAAILIFVLGSALCGFSQNVAELTAARILQGVGGAMMVPVGRLVMLRSVPKSDIVRIMVLLQLPGQVGPLLGPPIGGFITTYMSWRWIFLINVPIGLVGVLLATLFIQNHREDDTQKLDWQGFVLTGVSASCLMYGLEALSRPIADPAALGLLFAIGVGTGVWSLIHARRHRHALLDLSLLDIPSFRINMTAGTMFRIAVDGLPFMLPLMFQVALDMSAFTSGLLTLAGGIGSIVIRMLARPILKRYGFRSVLLVNGVISGLSLFACCLFTQSMPALAIMAILLIGSFFRSLQFVGMSTLAYADIEPSRMSKATSLASMAQQLCNGCGVALSAFILNLLLAYRHEAAPSVGDFQIAYGLVAILALSSVPMFAGLSRDIGQELSGHLRKRQAAEAV